MISEAGVISKPVSRGNPCLLSPTMMERRERSFMSMTRFHMTLRSSMFSVWKNMALSMMALMRLWADVMAWKSPVKCMLISSAGVRELLPPPVAPPLRPNTGPMEGCRSARQTFLPMACNPCAKPMETVVLPSPDGVGVMADTRMSLPGAAGLSNTSREILALLRPKGMTSFSSTPSLLIQSENAGVAMRT